MVNQESPLLTNLSNGSTSVLQTDGEFLRKTFATPDLLTNESLGLDLFGRFASLGIPKLVTKGRDYLIIEYLNGAKTAFESLQEGNLSNEELTRQISSFVAEAYQNFQLLGKYARAWEKKRAAILQSFKRNTAMLLSTGLIDNSDLAALQKNLAEIEALKSSPRQLSFLHRDLHLDNILIKEEEGIRKIYIIDFEHCQEGPIEFEFQNSLFWADEKSLPVEAIKRELSERYRIPYSDELEKTLLDLYFADQVNLATSLNDFAKVETLAGRYIRLKGECKFEPR